jgi:hypothetical protein
VDRFLWRATCPPLTPVANLGEFFFLVAVVSCTCQSGGALVAVILVEEIVTARHSGLLQVVEVDSARHFKFPFNLKLVEDGESFLGGGKESSS